MNNYKFSKEEKDSHKNEYINKVADFFIKGIENCNAPWMKPWSSSEYISDFNGVGGNTYRGLNSLYLPLIRQLVLNSDDPRWYTFKQAKDAGYTVKKGEKATGINFYSTIPVDKEGNQVDENSESKVRYQHVNRYYAVFNASQLGIHQLDENGLPKKDSEGNFIYDPIPAFEKPKTKLYDNEQIEIGEKILKDSKAKIYYNSNDSNYYSPSEDAIHLVPINRYENPVNYYSTAFHELSHWTGAENRLARDQKNTFGTPGYAREELVAEISSFMMCRDLNMDYTPRTDEQHISYIKSWVSELRDKPASIFEASHKAQDAESYIFKLSNINIVHNESSLKDSETPKNETVKPENKTSKQNHRIRNIKR